MSNPLRLILGAVMVSTSMAGVAAAQGEPPEPPEGPRDRVLLCESRDYRRAFCPSNTPIQAVELTRVISNSACVQGRSWGYESNGVWVDQGCRAYFRLVTSGPPRPTVVNIPCASRDYRLAWCDTGLNVLSVNVAAVHSTAACIAGQTWGTQGGSIWVNNGCRATFTVTGYTR